VADLLPKYGIEGEFVDGGDLKAWEKALSRPAQAVLFESPSNPMLDIVDIKAVCDMAHKAGAKVVLDNAFATPMLQRPLEWGADIVVHSATKYIDGQGRTLGGAILGSKEFILEKLQPIIRNTGPSLSPFNAWVLVKGMETLGLRIDRHCANAAKVADALAAHPAIARVLYPGRSDHPQHKLAMQQMSGAGGVVTFDLKAGKWAAFETLNRLRLIDISNNLGDAKSLVTHPATTTHMRIGAEERAKLGINDGTVRISVGLEDVEDIIGDLVQALGG
jgi:O-succinylhomoserine sulfhydrylase